MDKAERSKTWNGSPETKGLPFQSFRDLTKAVEDRRFSLGVDPLAAAQWSDGHNTRPKQLVVTGLSLLLIAAATAAVVVALATRQYWLLLALPIQGAVFYVSHPASPIRKWATVGGIASVVVFANLLLNHMTTAATLTAYAGLTFAAVRAAAFTANSAFRKALLAEENLFVAAYSNGECSVRDRSSEQVYERSQRSET
ncbi:MAG TPA: hypothetical protein VG778_05880 [Blastocatellia bacterium]|nr:hypothetical protein [Blastocatellia bacterium]